MADTFENELRSLLNKYSLENASDTPDFILAQYLMGCLENWNASIQRRESWYGRKLTFGADQPLPPPIPAQIYYDADHDNFYSFDGHGQGQAFWQMWRGRRIEFPQSKPTPKETVEG